MSRSGEHSTTGLSPTTTDRSLRNLPLLGIPASLAFGYVDEFNDFVRLKLTSTEGLEPSI